MKTPRPLTPRQQAFVEEYLIDMNATQAAIRAGYSRSYPDQTAWKLLRTPAVREAIDKAKEQRSRRTQIHADWLLSRLAEEALADIADLYDENGGLKPVDQWPLIWRQGLVAAVEVKELFEGRGESREAIGRVSQVKLSDRIKRLELIGKHIDVQAFREKVEVEVSGSLAERLARAKARVLE